MRTVDLALDIGCLRVHAAVAVEELGLLTELFNHLWHVRMRSAVSYRYEETYPERAVVPDVDSLVDLVRFVDSINRNGVVPEVLTAGRVPMNPCFAPWSEDEDTHIETLWPIPPNSPWKPIRTPS